jgi:hypothetical protein
MPANAQLLGLDRTEALGAGRAAADANGDGQKKGPRRRRRGAVLAGVAAALVLATLASAALKHGGTATPAANAGQPTSNQAATKQNQPAQRGVAVADKAAAQPVTGTTAAGASGGNLTAAAAEAGTLAQQYDSAAAKIEALHATGAAAGQNAILANLLRKTARAYSSAQQAAARGDSAGYTKAMADAKAAKSELQTASSQAAATPAPASAPAVPTGSGSSSSGSGSGSGSSSQPASKCSGDSQSDDPSDDSCGGGAP